MTPLRQRLIHDLQLRGYADRTVEAYTRTVVQLARFYHAAPDQLTEEQVRDYFLHLSTVQKVARSTHTIALCGIKCFYQQTLGRTWTVLDVARPQREKKLPVVLSRAEVWRILAAVRLPVYRACLTTIYACGLRLMEGAQLQVPDVDGDRAMLLIHGKGLPRIATCRSPTPPYSCSGRTGARITIRSGSFPRRRAVMRAVPPRQPSAPSDVAVYRVPSCARSNRVASTSAHTSTRCATATPPRRHASPGIRRRPAAHSSISRPHQPEDHRDLHAPDARTPGGGPRADQRPDGVEAATLIASGIRSA